MSGDMLKHYEGVVILTPVLQDAANKDIFDKICKIIVDNDGKIIENKMIGLKKLAYQIQNYSNGFYIFLEFTYNPANIERLKVFLRQNENIIRFMICSLNKEGILYNEKRRFNGDEVIKHINKKTVNI